MDWDEIKLTARSVLEQRGLSGEYQKRLEDEIYEIEKQGANANWTDRINSGDKWDANPKGLVLPWLLDRTPINPIEAGIKHNWVYQTDFPDIDLDFMPFARDPVKEYAANKYVHVCSVGNWITYKAKSALQDVTRALGGNLKVVMELTTNLPDEFDDLLLADHDKFFEDIKNPDPKIQQEAHQEIVRYKAFYDFKTANPRIVDMAYRLVGKIRAQGTHAGGIIIADRPIEDLVPMSYLNGVWTSQWTEGKRTQLSKFGLVKFDILGVKTVFYIWQAGNLIKKNYGIDINWNHMDPKADPPTAGEQIMPDGTKVPILFNDPEAIQHVNDLKTDSVFQIETPIQKRIIRDGVVKTFWDLIVYNAMGRPGPIESIPQYILNRDDPQSNWRNSEDERVINILNDTHGIICFQEQLQHMWMALARFTVPEAESARKIISKKWVEKLPQVQKQWIDGATKSIGATEAEKWWQLMFSFGRYAFNKCIASGTLVEDAVSHQTIPIERLFKGFRLESYDIKTQACVVDSVESLIPCGDQEVFEVEFDNGVKVETTLDHQFLCADNEYHTVREIFERDLDIVSF